MEKSGLHALQVDRALQDPMEPASDLLRLSTPCREGGCSACVIRVTNGANGSAAKLLNSCLTPIFALSGKTVEVVQNQSLHGLQCGFCGRGFAQALESTDIEQLNANLCRCGCYYEVSDIVQSGQAVQRPDVHKYRVEDFSTREEGVRVFCNPVYNGESFKTEKVFAPQSLDELRKAIALTAGKSFAFVVGGTELYYNLKMNHVISPVLVSLADVRELTKISLCNGRAEVGGAATLSEICTYFAKEKAPEHLRNLFQKLCETFASAPVRNAATLAGNLLNASPINDAPPVLAVLDSAVNLYDCETGLLRQVKAAEVVTGYRTTVLKSTEVVLSIVFDVERAQNSFYRKLAKRRMDDMSILTVCASFQPSCTGNELRDARIAINSTGPGCQRCDPLERCFENLSLSEDSLIALQFQLQRVTEEQLRPVFERSRDSFLHYTDIRCRAVPRIVFGFLEEFVQQQSGRSLALPTGKLLASKLPVRTTNLPFYKEGLKAIPAEEFCSTAPLLEGSLFVYPVFPRKPSGTFAVTKLPAEIRRIFPSLEALITSDGLAKQINPLGLSIKDELVLAQHGRFVSPGQPIALVVSKSWRDAYHIAGLLIKQGVISLSSEESQIPGSLQDALATPENNIMYKTEKHSCNEDETDRTTKDLTEIHTHLYTPAQEHAYFEQMCFSAQFSQSDSTVRVCGSTQHPSGLQAAIASCLGLSTAQVTVTPQKMGGAFGGKEADYMWGCLAAIGAYATQRPVRMMLEPSDDFKFTGKRHECDSENVLVFSRAPQESKMYRLSSFASRVHINGGISTDLTPAVAEKLLAHIGSGLDIRAYEYSVTAYRTLCPSGTAMRGFGVPQAVYIQEESLQEASRRLGFDPAQLRAETYSGRRGVLQAFTQILQKERYWDLREQQKRANDATRNIRYGIGVSAVEQGCGFQQKPFNAASGVLHVFRDGSVMYEHGAADMGQGINIRLELELGILLPECSGIVKIQSVGTEQLGVQPPAAASFSFALWAGVLKDCVEQLRREILESTAAITTTTTKSLSWEEVCETMWKGQRKMTFLGHFRPAVVLGTQFYQFVPGAALARVQVDTDTGEFVIDKVSIVLEVGRQLETSVTLGQVEGAFLQGLGWLTTEELAWEIDLQTGKRTGGIATAGVGTYKIPDMAAIPREMDVQLLQTDLESKGVGEPPLSLAVCVLMALEDAVGAYIRPPATPAAVIAALKTKGKNE